MEPKISVVIPCYNCERFIEKCLESIINQMYDNLEIIVVNDGSTDSTENVVKKYLSDKRVVYIKQENGGEAAARNSGIEVATGEYIGFVDSDDYIDPDMYCKLYKAISETDSDMAVSNYNQVYSDETIKSDYSTMSGREYKIQEDVLSYWVNVCAASRPNNYVWTRLYRTEIIEQSGIRFERFTHSADTLFNFKLLTYINKCVLVNEGLYYYVQRQGSGIHTVARKQNLAKLYADTFQVLADYYNSREEYKEFRRVLPIHAYTRMKNIFFYSRLAGLSDQEIINNISENWKDRDIFKYFMGEL